MKKLILATLCLFVTGCGTFNVSVEVLPPVTATAQFLATATTVPSPVPSATQAPPEPTATIMTTSTPTSTLPVAESITLTAIQMLDSLHGWGVEATGRIVKTSDGGNWWQDVTPHQGQFGSHSLSTFNNETAWVVPSQLEVSNVTWRTLDGGTTWEASQPIELGTGKYSPLGLQFPDARHGWLLVLAEPEGQNRQVLLYKSNDGGEIWTPMNNLNQGVTQSYLPSTMTTMAFFDGQTGWLGGWWGKDDPTQWLILKTDDGGAKWGTEALRLPAQKSIQCNGRSITGMAPGSMAVDVTCTMSRDPKYLYHRLFYLSTSGEPAWRSWVLPGELLSVYFLNAEQGWMMVTTDSPQLNQILYTENGGETWSKFNAVEWKQAQFDFVNKRNGWAIVGNGFATALVRTENGGKVWVQVRPALVQP